MLTKRQFECVDVFGTLSDFSLFGLLISACPQSGLVAALTDDSIYWLDENDRRCPASITLTHRLVFGVRFHLSEL